MNRAQFELIEAGDVVFFGSLRTPRRVLSVGKIRGRTYHVTMRKIRLSGTKSDLVVYEVGERALFIAKARLVRSREV